MKKLIGIAFCFGLFVTSGFAEAFIAPHVGFSNMYSKMKYIQSISGSTGFGSSFSTTYTTTHEVSWTPFSGGLDIGLVTKGGFTFLTDLHISTAGKAKYSKVSSSGLLEYDDVDLGVSATVFNLNFLLGYTYKGIKNLYLNFALGLGGGVGSWRIKSIGALKISGEKGLLVMLGVPIQLGIQYFFTDKIGINLSVNDVLGTSMFIMRTGMDGLSGNPGFMNNFTLKIGPVFRL